MKKWLSVLLMLAIVFTMTALTPDKAMAAPSYSYIRVRLSSLGPKQSMTFTTSGAYSIDGIANVSIPNGTTLVVEGVDDGTLKLTYGGTTVALGSSATLRPSANGTLRTYNGYFSNTTPVYYGGLMTFTAVSSGYFEMTNTLGLEDYVAAVVPREMSESWPQAALEAQAVAARTYAAAFIRGTGDYDVGDTTAYQVYGGVMSAPNSAAATLSTRGQLLSYGGSVIASYYSASNGGYTAKATSAAVLSGSMGSDKAYLMETIDQYDASSGASRRTYALPKTSNGTPVSNSDRNSQFYDSLANRIAAFYKIKNFDKSLLKIDEITALQATSGMVNARGYYLKIGGTFSYGNTYYKQSFELLADSVYNYTAKTYRMMDVSTSADGKSWLLTASRTGHAVGMSQWGANQQAKSGRTYRQILDFYYPGTTINTVATVGSASTTILPGTVIGGGSGTGGGSALAPSATAGTGSLSGHIPVRPDGSASGSSGGVIGPNGHTIVYPSATPISGGRYRPIRRSYIFTRGNADGPFIWRTVSSSDSSYWGRIYRINRTGDAAGTTVSGSGTGSGSGSGYTASTGYTPTTGTTTGTPVRSGGSGGTVIYSGRNTSALNPVGTTPGSGTSSGSSGNAAAGRSPTPAKNVLPTMPPAVTQDPLPAASATPQPSATASATPGDNPAPKAKTTGTGSDYTFLYKTASTAGGIRTIVKGGTDLNVLSWGADWVKVVYESAVCYVEASKVTAYTPENLQTAQYGAVTLPDNENSFIYSDPNTASATKLKTLTSGMTLRTVDWKYTAAGITGDWVQVEYETDKIGYVLLKYLTPTASAPATASPSPSPSATSSSGMTEFGSVKIAQTPDVVKAYGSSTMTDAHLFKTMTPGETVTLVQRDILPGISKVLIGQTVAFIYTMYLTA